MAPAPAKILTWLTQTLGSTMKCKIMARARHRTCLRLLEIMPFRGLPMMGEGIPLRIKTSRNLTFSGNKNSGQSRKLKCRLIWEL